MNKPQYLAELGQLLIFMTHADREKTLARYGALFDAAGPEGQQALLDQLGSTTRQAVRLSRIYDAAHGYEDELLDALEARARAVPAPDDVPEQKAEPEKPASRVAGDLPQFDLDDLPDLAALPDEPAPEPEPEPEPEPAPAQEPQPSADSQPDQQPAEPAEQAEKAAPAPEPPAADPEYEELWGKRPAPAQPAEAPAQPAVPAQEPAEKPQQPPAPAAPRTFQAVERVIPLWAGIPLFALSVIFLAVPLALLCLALIPVLLIPGAVVLFGAFLAVIGGLWCISIVADAAVLFGAALILLALGLMILWIGLWADVAMVTGFSKALLGLADLTLGKKVTVHA